MARRSFAHFLLSFLVLVSATQAALLADFNPALNSTVRIADIGNLNSGLCPADQTGCKGAATPTRDEVFSVKNKRFVFTKPANYDRAEVHGIKSHPFAVNKTYYLGWDFQLSGFPPKVNCTGKPSACVVQSNRIFQYHTFGSPNTLNIPLQLFISPGKKTVDFVGMAYKNGKDAKDGRFATTLWTSPPLSTSKVYKVAIRITTARSSDGVTQFWWNDSLQLLNPINGTTKSTAVNLQTWDGTTVDPKWGVYGAWTTKLSTTIGRIRLGEAVEDVVP